MLSACRAFRRAYATHTRTPRAAREARDLSAPKAVRERRAAQGKDDIANHLSPSEFTSYQRSLTLGNLVGKGKDGAEPTPLEWLSRLNARRSRIRGIRIKEKDGKKEVEAVGQKVYLPNIIFRLVRNFTPPGKPYNPYEATFRIPQSVTKTDVRSYLLAVYGVETTYIRTDNYLSPLTRTRDGGWKTKSHKTYKRAVVGLVKPFDYPGAIEDFAGPERRRRLEWIEENFAIHALKLSRRAAYLKMTKQGSGGGRFVWRRLHIVRRGQILKAVGEARMRREHSLNATKQFMEEAREEGRPVKQVDFKRIRERASQMRELDDYRRAQVAAQTRRQ